MNYLMGSIFVILALMLTGASLYNLLIKPSEKFNIFPNRFGENRLPNSRTTVVLNMVMLFVGIFIGYLGYNFIFLKS